MDWKARELSKARRLEANMSSGMRLYTWVSVGGKQLQDTVLLEGARMAAGILFGTLWPLLYCWDSWLAP
jgi:hypothetical protein